VNKLHVDITALDIVTIVQSPISHPVRFFFLYPCPTHPALSTEHFALLARS
jgi:hypothetical protein